MNSLAGPMAIVAALAPLLPPLAHTADVDAAIVFAVDVSASIDPATADLQREGHAAAISSPEVVAAITGNRTGCIAVAYVEWASSGDARSVVPWTSVCGLGDAQAVASVIRREGDRGFGCERRCATSISFAIDVGCMLLDNYVGSVSRKIIDISANGTNNDGLPVAGSRLRAIAKGYTINAIAIPEVILGQVYDFTAYFADNVIGGPRAFVIALSSTGDYAAALRRKLVTEISLSIRSSRNEMTAHE
ncbi:hypothetical protein ASD64_12510 [Mesorhizobium sp. Root157]|uniref:DUF1194 domain-containing protein n=1 Tax=Mesorhizobium sp. Root157 TaxID=1736477 RepID=UPI0006F8F9E7|nr:DUF1194 domain-containing protein [Mesorhizobium sp. Root157]KQZ78170.1 hypothetical protein ASD64_12510 [Mesorhizobium sp. Root157]